MEKQEWTDDREVLLFADQDGVYYAIPRAVVEQHRISGEQIAEAEQLFGYDVTGYSGGGEKGPLNVESARASSRANVDAAASGHPQTFLAVFTMLPGGIGVAAANRPGTMSQPPNPGTQEKK